MAKAADGEAFLPFSRWSQKAFHMRFSYMEPTVNSLDEEKSTSFELKII